MADADKPEVLGAAGDDSPHQQPVEQPGEPRREPHPPEPEKQPPQHSSSSNGVKMENDESVKEDKSELKEKSSGNKKANRFHPYSKDKNSGTGEKKGPNRNRVFISNIPYDMKWQAIKDLMREKVGEVTYVELFKDAEGKSRGCGVVEFKDEEFVKKALETMNKYDLSGRPLNIKEDPDGENARRALQRTGGSFPGGHVPDMGSGLMNLPPSILNNPNIPPEVISNLQAGRLGSTIFVANLDFKVGWKKLKEVFSIAGTVKRADIKEDKDGKSRGMGTVTFEQAIEAVQAISMFNGQFLFDRPMHVKMDDKSVPHEDYRSHDSKTPQLPRGLGGIGMGLGPGGQPISASQLNIGGVMGNLGPSGMGMDGPGFGGMNRIGGGIGFGGLEAMNSMGGFGGVGRMGELYRGAMTSSMERDFGRGDIGLNRGFGDSFGRLGGGMGGMNSVTGGMGMGLDRMSSSFDRMGPGIGAILERSIDMDRGFLSGPMGSGMRDRIGSKGNQIFVRNLPFDLTWQKLKEKFSQCGHVMFAEIKMENGKSKGCGTVRFDSPESAEKACRIMNGIKISGREIDVRLDRNA
ncbi:myelin expression factor 2 isoform X2 [Prionailurus viverrinus]|uniref:RRM domain-containing protein n=2 Tax=Felinae TaxID=338152 RepID=A0ABI7XAM7_FELCA|nr:myelin expression factor 2 isoform X2 [Felis catus]XP_025775402.1 myelin expression factor 2 isoform X2 [Puma concolor]XP_040348539.1 myelin expression factor 2 isoform X2 [Puma yagouaroundi]XP_045305776.1 myelin expression factor 2 isoform X2 [Leopardus geoffroyi]XP_046931104.1 myelin expression factor 2 isoform X2 [Lynx rufus]XP_047719520.1 myelin expression factor 2 isoform X2 [Prionailurus viverrinus]XP_049469553.1 myelin expression factor 2 isoform X2 [Panthera uncia]XP_058593819.1 m